MHNQLDYDGFMEIKFSLSGGDLKKVDRLTVLLPLDRKIVKFLLPGVSVLRAGELTGAGYRNRAANLWIGNQEEGLAFSFDRNPFRRLAPSGRGGAERRRRFPETQSCGRSGTVAGRRGDFPFLSAADSDQTVSGPAGTRQGHMAVGRVEPPARLSRPLQNR
ncbi:hypothetical protein [uncultured Victivallis sp.]|uniref:hypothetical protein n=1 Tax=uncultured Victivallis sp. TaxID=354118 RepID=UPI002589CC61|nr:hypothetical protein [uncultured Victivallis sp.]